MKLIFRIFGGIVISLFFVSNVYASFNTNDYEGSHNNLTNYGVTGSLDTPFINNNSSALFERSNYDYLKIDDNSQTGFDFSTAFTYEAWIKPLGENWPNDTEALFSHSKGFADGGYHIAIDSYWTPKGTIRAYALDGDGHSSSYYCADTISRQEWTHIAVVFDGSQTGSGQFKFYYNGVVCSTTDGGSTGNVETILNSSVPVYIGGATHDSVYPSLISSWYFDGLMDEVRLWNDVRTSQEISDNYYSELSDVHAQGLVSYYPFDDLYIPGGTPTPTETPTLTDSDGDGYYAEVNDCADTNASIHPGAIETCDGLDNNCTGGIDENLSRQTSCGYGACLGNVGNETCTAGTWGGDTCNPLAGAEQETCDNIDNDCDSSVDEDLNQQSFNQNGLCSGNTDICSAGEWLPYEENYIPVSEICDGLDNDCNNSIDENLSGLTSCGVGACASEGEITCINGIEDNTCTEGTPVTETCDNIDNDCDGSSDENLTRTTTCGIGSCSENVGYETCTSGTWGNDTCSQFEGATVETCDNLDNDCDGSIDEDLDQSTSNQNGLCSGNTEFCSSGDWFPSSQNYEPIFEICDNNDNDCDGLVDEDLTQPSTCGIGACLGNEGYETCTAGTWGDNTCDPYAGVEQETCDNSDNDCDGTVDEDLNRQSLDQYGLCSGNTDICSAGEWLPNEENYIPVSETCDGLDNDCDNSTDEDLFRPSSNINGLCSGNTDVCASATWVANGGNYQPMSEICDGLDNNCDGSEDEGNVCDLDLDGVPNAQDFCPNTSEDAFTKLGVNRWMWIDSNWKSTPSNGKGPVVNYTITLTKGCSCSQILNSLNANKPLQYGEMDGLRKFGCTIGIMNDFIKLVNTSNHSFIGSWFFNLNGGGFK
jgi:hypothetical protein